MITPAACYARWKRRERSVASTDTILLLLLTMPAINVISVILEMSKGVVLHKEHGSRGLCMQYEVLCLEAEDRGAM